MSCAAAPRPSPARTSHRASRSTSPARSAPSHWMRCPASIGTRGVGVGRVRHPPARAGAGGVPRRHLRPPVRGEGRGHPRPPDHLELALPPPGREHRPRERRAHPGERDRPHPRRAGRLAGARGQRAGAIGRQLRDLEPAGHGADIARAVRLHAGAPVGDYPHKLLAALRASAPAGVEDPTVVVLTPGVYNSAYFEHTLLARLMGVELVEGRDLFCSGGRVWMRTTAGPTQVDA